MNKGEIDKGVIKMPNVKCSVANCEYWAKGNNCAAEAIMVEIDQHANRNVEFANEDFSSHQDSAKNTSNTCCHTFEPKKQ